MTKTTYAIRLGEDADGRSFYLGQLDVNLQGVRRLENALTYKTRYRAQWIADNYGGTVVLVVGK